MDKAQALDLIRADTAPPPPGAPFTVDIMRPDDALGVARLFYAIYGESYPFEDAYIPEKIAQANASGRVMTAVARLAGGQIVAQAALYQSSPANPRLYEYGQMLTLPAYRSSLASYRLTKLLTNMLTASPDLDGGFAETVTYTPVTQKFCRHFGWVETALEPSLMPAGAYSLEGAGERRVGCLLCFSVHKDAPRILHLPGEYHDMARAILDGLPLRRTLASGQACPAPGESLIDSRHFAFAGVTRANVSRPGADFAARIQTLEDQAKAAGSALVQCFVALDDPAGAYGVAALRDRGYFAGGLAPIWFGPDAWLMQKLSVPPDFEHMVLYSPRAGVLRDLARADWQRAAKP